MNKALAIGGSAVAVAALAIALFSPFGDDRSGRDAARGVPDPDGRLAAERRGALVDQIVVTQEADAGKIAGLIESGSHHLFASGIANTTIFRRLLDSQRTTFERSYGTSMELTLNPAGPYFENGELNPFHIREVREALNWLVDRRHVAEELYGGLAVPRYLPISTAFPDYARLADVARELETRYRHDAARAKRTIADHMEAAGATMQRGRWHYDGRPVQIRVLIRTDDERQRVGDYVANIMEDAGFATSRLYRNAEEASRIWIAGDPSAGRWHIYTGAWISTAINRDVADNFTFYYTRRGRPEPLWQIYDPDPELDRLAERLERRDYADWDERQAMMARVLELSMQDSVRIWVVDQLNIWPRATEVEAGMDLAGGFSGSRLWPYTLRFRDRVGGSIVIASPGVLTEPWNPVAGTNWIHDRMIVRALADPPLMPDPFTGLFWPQRIAAAEVTVQEDAHVERTHDWLRVDSARDIRVPDDTWIDWDSNAQRFVTVGEKYPEGLSARTRVRVQYEDGFLDRTWHDGTRMSLADIVLPLILTFARADEDSPLFDVSHVPAFEVFQRQFRGWRIVSDEPLVMEVYNDQVFPDAETIVQARAPAPSPWHKLALGIRAELAEELAFSSHKADRMRVDWMSYIAGPSLAVLDRQRERALAQAWVPWADALHPFLRDADEVAQRYEALGHWRQELGHYWVGDGPVYLHAVEPLVRTLVLRRFEDFPDPSDKWLRFTQAEIPELTLDGPVVVESFDTAAFDVDITFGGEPYPVEALTGVRFLLFDGNDRLIRRGEAETGDDGRWRVMLTREDIRALGTGANTLDVIVTTDRVAMPASATHAFATVPRLETGQ